MHRQPEPEPGLPLHEAISRHFACHRCGNCCKGDGLVRLKVREADRIADALGLTRRQFVKEYCVRIDDKTWALKDRLVPSPTRPGRRERWCVFLELGADGLYGCRINGAKPKQCGEFPMKWRNADSLTTCAGLRALVAATRRSDADADSDDPNEQAGGD